MKRVAAFVVLTAAFTAPFWWYISQHRGAPATQDAGYGLMWGPAFAALVVTYGRWGELGWRWPARRYLLAGWLIPIGYTVLAYGTAWIAGEGRFAGADEIAATRAYYQLPDAGGATVIGLALVAGATLQVLTNAALALGEELGWRGYLVPALAPRFGVRATGLISGAIWAAWHYPLFFLAKHSAAGPSLAWELGCFTVMVLAVGVILAWLRMRSASVWPAVILHAAHNAFTSTCDGITGDTGRTRWVFSETGIALAIATALVAVYVWIRLIPSRDRTAPT